MTNEEAEAIFTLMENIEKLRLELYSCVCSVGSLSHPVVVDVSERLDRLLDEYMKKRKPTA